MEHRDRTRRLAGRDVAVTVLGVPPSAKATVNITSPAGYRLEYGIDIDQYGMARLTFGSTAPAGEYTVRVTIAERTLTTVLRID